MEQETGVLETEEGEERIDGRFVRAGVEAGKPALLEPDTDDLALRFYPQLAGLARYRKQRQDVWQGNGFERTFKRHGYPQYLVDPMDN